MSVADSAAGTINCSKCGAVNTADRKFCGECGSPLVAAAASDHTAGPPPIPSYVPPVLPVQPKTPTKMWIGVGGAVVLVLAIIGVFAAPYLGLKKKVVIGTKDEVFYTGNATEQDARSLGEALKGAGYFTDRGVSVTLAKESDWTTVSFVIQQDAWKDPGNVAAFGVIGRMIAPVVGDVPIRVRLTGDNSRTQKELYID